MHRLSQFHICTIVCAANKRRGQTKVFPLLLIPLLFLAAVRRFPVESYTDISFMPGYDKIDSCALHTIWKYHNAKDFIRCNLSFGSHEIGGIPHKRWHLLHRMPTASQWRVAFCAAKCVAYGKERWEIQKREGKLGFLLSFARCMSGHAHMKDVNTTYSSL